MTKQTTPFLRKRHGLILLAALVALPAIAAPLALRPLTITPQQRESAPNLTLPALSASTGIQLTRAYGRDDEDCIIGTRRSTDAQGNVTVTRELICR